MVVDVDVNVDVIVGGKRFVVMQITAASQARAWK